MALERALSDVPIDLPYPWDYPAPLPDPGCAECASLVQQINRAEYPGSDSYDPSKASDLRVKMARHQRGEVPA
jgi:hypothetical protein